MKAVILAAGVGSRLGNPYPKTLCKLPDGQTIISRQLKILNDKGINEVIIVVGFKMSLIMEHVPSAFFRYNPTYYLTNTSKSLLCGFENVDDDILWMNGDVIFDPEVIERMSGKDGNLIAVNTNKCAEEEIKYTLDDKGHIKEISKAVPKGLGEAVGVNKVSRADLPKLRHALEQCESNDYFERGIELAIEKGVSFTPVDISDTKCIEIDMEEDFDRAVGDFY